MGINQINSRSENLKAREVMVKLSLVLTYAGYDIAVAPPGEVGPDLVAKSQDDVLEFEVKICTSLESLQHVARGSGQDGRHHLVLAVRGNEAIYTDSALVKKLRPHLHQIKLRSVGSPA